MHRCLWLQRNDSVGCTRFHLENRSEAKFGSSRCVTDFPLCIANSILVCVFQISCSMFLKARTFNAQKCIVSPLPRQPDLVRTTSHGIQTVHEVKFSSRGGGYRCNHIENTFSPRGFFVGRCLLATENKHLRLSLASTILSASLGCRSRLASCDVSLTPPRGCPGTSGRSCGP